MKTNQDILAVRAARFAKKHAAASQDLEAILLFQRGGFRYALSDSSLREARALRNACPIPGASPTIPAALHYRGEIISLHDIRPFLSGAVDSQAAWVLVVQVGNDTFGLLADELIGNVNLTADDLQPVPVTLGALGACFRGVFDSDVLLIDTPALAAAPGFFDAFS